VRGEITPHVHSAHVSEGQKLGQSEQPVRLSQHDHVPADTIPRGQGGKGRRGRRRAKGGGLEPYKNVKGAASDGSRSAPSKSEEGRQTVGEVIGADECGEATHRS